jgi:photosystem II stability/assembly factor-like uncharacterized protein
LALLAVGCGTASSGHPAIFPASPSGSKPAAPPSTQSAAPAASTVGAHCAGGAVYSAPGSPAQVPSLDALAFVSPERGWVAGAGRILATTDGGQTWARRYAGSAQVDQVDFVDARHGWAVGTTGLLRTTDGGAAWTAVADPCGSIRSVRFVTPDLGYAIAGGSQVRTDAGLPAPAIGGELIATTDGGQRWAAVAGAPARAQTACFTSPASGFLGTPGKVWRTSDAGRTWTLAFAEPAMSAAMHSATPDTTVLECAGKSAAWVLFLGSSAAMGHAPYLAYATPSAHTVRALFEESYIESAARPQVHAPDGPGSYPGPFSAISPDTAVFVGFDPAVGYGAAPVDVVTGAGLARGGDVSGISQAYGTAFVSATQGWAIGKNMQTGEYGIEATTNGGRTWTSQYRTR